jgi:molecular chaperone HtpG
VVVDEKDPTVQMQEMLRQMGQDNMPEIKPILEINPTHPIVKKLEEIKDDKSFEDISRLLLEQALLIEGVEIKNPADFVKRINSMMEKAL